MKDRIRKNKDLDAATLWETLRRHSEDYPLEIRGGEAWYDEDMDRICISSLSKGGDKNITRKKFNEYFAACKKPPSRAE
jgi:hypothetical protein